MARLLFSALIFLIAVHAPADDPKGDRAKKVLADESDKLQGEWKVVRVEGTEIPKEGGLPVTIKGDTITIGTSNPACKFKIDPGQDPKWFDLNMGDLFGGKEESFAPGIYQLDGDKLSIAIVTQSESTGATLTYKPRPKNFKDKFPGQIMHLERVKK